MAAGKKKPVRPAKPATSGNSKPLVQGEGDYISGKRYQQEAQRFAKEHDTERLARAAAPRTRMEQRELVEAEQKGRSKARTGKKASPR